MYDPVAFDNWDPEEDGVLGLVEKLDPGQAIIQVLTTILTACSYLPPVHKIIDARKGKEIDVSKRNFRTMMGGRTAREWSDSHIRETYDDRVERGIIDPKEFPFEEFKESFKENNQ